MAKKSNNNILVMVVVLVAVIAAGGFYAWKNYDKRDSDDFVVAKINGEKVYNSDANQQLVRMTKGARGSDFSALDEQSKNIVLREMAAQKMLLKDAYRSGVDSNKEVKEKVQKFKDQIVKDEFLSEMAKEKITDEKIKSHYQDLVKKLEGREQYNVKHILVKTEKDANSVLKLLKRESFEKVAREKSIDQKTALTGGDLGVLIGGTMVKEIEDAVSNLKVGSTSKPVKTSFGWHILKLEGKQPAQAAEFDKVKPAIARDLYQEIIKQYVTDLVKDADIEILSVADKDDKEGEAAGSEEAADKEDLSKTSAEPASEADNG